MASMPINLEIGQWIVVTSCLSSKPTLFEKTNIIAHEIVHTLGFRHANFGCSTNLESACDYAFWENPVWGANDLWGTPICDNNSLMTSSHIGNTFSDNDIKAARMLYPDGMPPTITGVVTGT